MQFNDTLQNIKTYEAGKPIELVVREFGIEPEAIVKLASNENPYGVSPKVQEAVAKNLQNMYLYPDDSMFELKEALGAHFDVESQNIIIGSGSDQIIEFAIHAKANRDNAILINSVTFAMYEIYAKHVGTKIIRTSSREHNLDEFYTLYKEHKPAMIFLCTPNNPTGDAINKDALLAFLRKIDKETLVVVDGAYMEYAAYKDASKSITPKELCEEFENVLYLGTFSKAYALGGMRIGYGIASKQIIEALYKLRPPFNVTTLSLVAAKSALEDREFVQMSIAKNFQQMQRYEEFAKKKEIETIPSYTNFITLLLKDDQNSSEISNNLLKKGIIVRDLSSYNLNAIRVTVGTEKQNDRLFEELKKLI
ncbi:Biosynthetic Aromatic amino acid aminotransferase beta @ Histidinol-phosphate aminotransferase [hydrothermal vent metagenome]|uniref:Biosynthetic Aromatic amino acid aminotransferase beta @ Histidinol-phosphate aminotransferase n=1 Tax=hydrothermal vent metagenome TaxID=652676 RepID=A0A1W1C4W4_9ZZZZ